MHHPYWWTWTPAWRKTTEMSNSPRCHWLKAITDGVYCAVIFLLLHVMMVVMPQFNFCMEHSDTWSRGAFSLKAEDLLSRVQQHPSESMKTALLPIVNALIGQPLLRHPDEDVKVSVACCICELARVTAPDQPYEDEDMKEVFELTVRALGTLSLGSGRSYSKAVSVLHNLAILRLGVLMLDLECSNLIVDMIKLFVGTTRSNHPDYVFSDMETVMTTVIDESREFTLELLICIIRSMMENQNDSTLQWKLGEIVCKRCAAKIQSYLPRAAELMNEDLNDITRVVFPVPGVSEREQRVVGEHVLDPLSLGGGGPSADESPRLDMKESSTPQMSSDLLGNALSSEKLENDQNRNTDTNIDENLDSLESVAASCRAKLESIPGKRKRKLNSLFKPEEGYYHRSLNGETEVSHLYSVTGSRDGGTCHLGETSKGKHKSKLNIQKQQVSRNSINEELIGCLIQVWWPDDKEFYQGIVHSFDYKESKHLVTYDDGDVELLDLSNEQWILLPGRNLVDQEAPREAESNPQVSTEQEGLKTRLPDHL